MFIQDIQFLKLFSFPRKYIAYIYRFSLFNIKPLVFKVFLTIQASNLIYLHLHQITCCSDMFILNMIGISISVQNHRPLNFCKQTAIGFFCSILLSCSGIIRLSLEITESFRADIFSLLTYIPMSFCRLYIR